jgi:hypothetical protein
VGGKAELTGRPGSIGPTVDESNLPTDRGNQDVRKTVSVGVAKACHPWRFPGSANRRIEADSGTGHSPLATQIEPGDTAAVAGAAGPNQDIGQTVAIDVAG